MITMPILLMVACICVGGLLLAPLVLLITHPDHWPWRRDRSRPNSTITVIGVDPADNALVEDFMAGLHRGGRSRPIDQTRSHHD